jgi:cardiolipin synthase
VVAALYAAERQVILTSAYFVPDEALVLALRLAALRGVDVHLIIPERSDQASADAACRAYFQELLDVGVHIHLHQSGILHAKSMSIDDTVAMIGTANLDWRSLYLNYELVLFLYSQDVAVKLRTLQQRYFEQSRPLDRDAWRRRPLTQQWFEHTAKLLSPLL